METTATGAAYLAGLAVGFWNSKEQLEQNGAIDRVFTPSIPVEQQEKMVRGWNRAVKCSYGWARDDV